MTYHCPHCPHCAMSDHLSSVTLHRKKWAGSPDIWIGGSASSILELINAGMVKRLDSGWHIPTDSFPH